MNVLFLHQNFPAQFVHIAGALEAAGHQCLALVPETNQRPRIIETATYAYRGSDRPAAEPGADYLSNVTRGRAAASAMSRLKAEGVTPDIVIGHCGWGETLFVRDIWPKARIIVHGEFYYASQGADAGFDPEFSCADPLPAAIKLRTRNAGIMQAVIDADCAVAPTQWQKSRFPNELQSKMYVLHEGIDTRLARPNPSATVRLGRDNLRLRPGDEVVTFVSRNLEPYRGYHSFMRALPRILRERPNARVVIAGGDQVSYGPALKEGSWKARFLNEVQPHLDINRVHFVNLIPHGLFLQLMQVTAVHVYLTYPFVLSWSMLEAMSCGAPIVGSKTPPVEEIISHGKNGMLVDFFDADGIAKAVIDVLSGSARMDVLRAAARQTIVDRFDLSSICLPGWMRLIESVAIGTSDDRSKKGLLCNPL